MGWRELEPESDLLQIRRVREARGVPMEHSGGVSGRLLSVSVTWRPA